MPKKMIRKYLPDPEKIANIQGLGFLRHRLQDPNLWHLNRHSASGAMFWGLWCALLPMPFQMIPAAIAALIFSASLTVIQAWDGLFHHKRLWIIQTQALNKFRELNQDLLHIETTNNFEQDLINDCYKRYKEIYTTWNTEWLELRIKE